MKKYRAFTLIELILVIVIIGILAAVAVNVKTGNTPVSISLKAEAEHLANMIRYVQARAMDRDDLYWIRFTPGANPSFILRSGPKGTPVLVNNPATGTSTAVTLPGLSMTLGPKISSGDLTFNGEGIPYGNGDVALSDISIKRIY